MDLLSKAQFDDLLGSVASDLAALDNKDLTLVGQVAVGHDGGYYDLDDDFCQTNGFAYVVHAFKTKDDH